MNLAANIMPAFLRVLLVLTIGNFRKKNQVNIENHKYICRNA